MITTCIPKPRSEFEIDFPNHSPAFEYDGSIIIQIKEHTSPQHVRRKTIEAIEGFCKRDFTKKDRD